MNNFLNIMEPIKFLAIMLGGMITCAEEDVLNIEFDIGIAPLMEQIISDIDYLETTTSYHKLSNTSHIKIWIVR